LVLEENFFEYKTIIDDKVIDLISKHGNLFDNCYGSLNYEYTHSQPSSDYWAFYDKSISEDGSRRLWKEIAYPLSSRSYRFDNYEYVEYRGNKLNYIEGLTSFSSKYASEIRINWLNGKKATFDLGSFDLLEPEMVRLNKPFQILMAKPISYFKEHPFELNLIKLPETWNNVILFSSSSSFRYNSTKYNADNIFLNVHSKYYKFYDFPLYAHMRQGILSITKEELIDEKHCFALLLNTILSYQDEKWLGLCEKKAEIMQHVFDMLQVTEVYLLEERTPVVISLTTWKSVYSDDTINKVVPRITEDIYLFKGKSKFKRRKKTTKKNGIAKSEND